MPIALPDNPAAIAERFWSLVYFDPRPGACWPYQGYRRKGGQGYGQHWIKRRPIYAHRLAFFLTRGRWPNRGRHRCDFPPCSRPSHVIEGTQAQNLADARERGRMRWRHGESHPCAKLTIAAVRRIRSDYVPRVVTMRMLAAREGVSRSVVQQVLENTIWRGV